MTSGSADLYSDLPAVTDVRGAAAVLGISERKARQMVADGELGHLRLGRLVRIPRHSLLALIASGTEDRP